MKKTLKTCTTLLMIATLLNAFQIRSIALAKEEVELPPDSEPQGVPKLREIPEGRLIEDGNAKYWCYTKDEHKQLGHVLIDYGELWMYMNYLEEYQETTSNDTSILTLQANSWKSEAKSQKDRADFLSNLWDSEHELRLSLEKKNNAWKLTPWIIVIVESVVFAGLGAYVLAETAK